MYWDPPRVCFIMPLIERPVMWYGVLFMTGFMLGYLVIIPLLKTLFAPRGEKEAKALSLLLADRLLRYILAGTLIGARLGHVFFYEWPYYKHHLFSIFKIWEGGLASHGGAIGVLIALYFFIKRSEGLKFITTLDLVTIPVSLAIVFIRLGNFVNQEILGTPTNLPWAVTFGHPADGGAIVPRHPSQLYEALAYLLIFALLFTIWKKATRLKEGALSGLFFMLAFSSRILVEFTKEPLSQMRDESFLTTGQLLSVPFIILGFYLFFFLKNEKITRQPLS